MNIEFAVLGLIKMSPDASGYQLKSIVDKSSGHVTQIHLSKIYPALKRLTEKGLLTYRSVPQQGRLDQKFYSLTDEGQKVLDEWMTKPFDFGTNRGWFDDYLLQFSGMVYLNNDAICSFIDQGIARLEQEIAYGKNEAETNDMGFVDDMDETLRERYLQLWASERQLLIEESANRLAWLRQMRKVYTAS